MRTILGVNLQLLKASAFAAALVLAATACDKKHKEVEVSGVVVHHERPIAHAVVYVAYDKSEFPGADYAFDHETTADHDGHFHFHDLERGTHYLYSVGFDTAVNDSVKGGIAAEIDGKDEEVEVDVPVTE